MSCGPPGGAEDVCVRAPPATRYRAAAGGAAASSTTRRTPGTGRVRRPQPLTAPDMIPATSWRPVNMNSTMSGSVTRNTPAITSE